jgi:hypothetical protein
VAARPVRHILRIAIKVFVFILLCIVVLVAATVAHIKHYPFVLETAVRKVAFPHFFIRPSIIDAWGPLTIQVAPLDDDHVAVGFIAEMAVFKKQGANLTICARVGGYGAIHDFEMYRGTLYAAAGIENLAWYDLTEPCSPKKLGSLDYEGYGYAIHVENDRLYLANREAGLQVFRLDHDGTPHYLRTRFGTINPEEEGSEWMTNDVIRFSGRMAAADGKKGIVLFDPDGEFGQYSFETFPEPVQPDPDRPTNIDPAPLRLRSSGDILFAAMREKGVAVFSETDIGSVEFLGSFKPDEGEALDLEVADGLLYVSTTAGKIHAYRLPLESIEHPVQEIVYSPDATGGEMIFDLAVTDREIYAASAGAGVFRFEIGDPQLRGLWQSPDDARDVVRIGPFLVSAMGAGGLTVYRVDGDNLIPAGHLELPSFAYTVTSLGGNRVAVAGELSGTLIVEIEPSGTPVLQETIDTPELVFSTVKCGDDLVTTNGIYGLMRYKPGPDGPFQLLPGPDGPFPLLPGAKTDGPVYVMKALCWNGVAIGANVTGTVRTGSVDPEDVFETVPERCYNGSQSPDGRTFAMACGGNTVHLWHRKDEDSPAEHESFSSDSDIISFLFDPPFFLVGSFDSRVDVYRLDGATAVHVNQLEIPGRPRAMVRDSGGIWIAAGPEGILRIEAGDSVQQDEISPVGRPR